MPNYNPSLTETHNIARRTINPSGDSKARLRSLGLDVETEDAANPLFYGVAIPANWKVTVSGGATTFFDGNGNERIVQFIRGTRDDIRDAFVYFS